MNKHIILWNSAMLYVLTLIVFCVACDSDENSTNFENETILDCKNLKVRKVILTDNSVEFPDQKVFRVTVENTCKRCDESLFHVYENFYMIDKISGDTVGRHEYWYLQPPDNKSSVDYDLEAEVDALPNLDNIKFVLYSTCLDIKYESQQ